MILKIITLDDVKETEIECDSFEFRSNQVANWIQVVKDGHKEIIHRVAVIKTEDVLGN